MSAIPPRPGRCPAEEKRRRILELQGAVAAGETPIAAVKRLAPTWGITSRRNASRYIDALLATWKRDRRLSSRAALDVAVERRELVFRLALARDDFTAALRAQDGIDELLGVGERSDGDRDRALARVVADLLDVVRSGSTDTGVLLRIIGRAEAVVAGEPPPALPIDLDLSSLPEDARAKLRDVASALVAARADGSESSNGTATEIT